MQHAVPEHTHESFLANVKVTSSAARAFSPMPERLPFTNSATRAILTPRHTTAPQGAERFASVDKSANQKLSVAKSAPRTAKDWR